MRWAQANYPLDLADMVGWVRSHAPPGGRVLEIGCGDAAITHALAAAGLDVVGVDPNGPENDLLVVRSPFEDYEAPPFDVVFASVSLHHLPEPSSASDALRRLTGPGSVVLAREFDRVVLDDEPTLRWWFHQRHAQQALEIDEDHLVAADFDEFMASWREQMAHHVLPWSTVLDVLTDAGLSTRSHTSSPYLFRWGLDESVRPLEEALIAHGYIKQVGIRWIGERRS